MAETIEYTDNFDVSAGYKRELYDGGNFLSSLIRAEIGPAQKTGNFLDDFFRISQRGSTILNEILGGLTIFFTIVYILALNGIVLENTGMSRHAVFFSSTLAAGLFTLVMGLFINLPVVLGPSMALAIFFAQVSTTCEENPTGDVDGTHCDGWGRHSLPWTDTMGAVFLSGWFYAFFTFAGVRGYLYAAVPKSLRASIAVGTGFFITMVGLKIGHITRVTLNREFVEDVSTAAGCVANGNSWTCDENVDLNVKWYNHGIANFSTDPYARIAVLGIVFASALEMFRVKGSLIIAIWLATFIGINYGYRCKSSWLPAENDDSIHECVTDLSIWTGHGTHKSENIPFIVDIRQTVGGHLSFEFAKKPFFWQVVFTFLFFELYDSYGALTGIVTRMGDTRNHPTVATDRVNRAMVIDGFGVWLGAIMGCNSVTVYIESLTGVEAGARTGLAAVVTAICLLLCLLWIYPFVYIIPACATTCALVMVGVNTIQEYKNIDTSDYVHLFSGFVTIAVMGFTYSIVNGICFGFISYTGLQLTIFHLNLLKEWVPASYWPSWLKVREGVETQLPHPVLIITSAFMAARFCLLLQQ